MVREHQANPVLLRPPGRTVLGSRLWLWVGGGLAIACALPVTFRTAFLLGYDLALVGLFLYERAVLSSAGLEALRQVPRRMAAHTSTSLELTIHHAAKRALRVTLQQDAAGALHVDPEITRHTVKPEQSLVIRSALHARGHGIWHLRQVGARVETWWGVAARIEQLASSDPVRVLPYRTRRKRSALRVRPTSLGATPQPSQAAAPGSETEALRAYVSSDPMRAIDWKASAKRHRLVARSYQPERGQALWLVVDASRVMSLPVDATTSPERTRFEAALEAALALAEASLLAGDSVALMVYAQSELLAVPPRRGRAHLRELLERVAQVQSQAEALDVAGLLRALQLRAPKRSCLVLFTDLDNQADLQLLAEHAPMLTRRHLSLCVTLSAQHLTHAVQREVRDEDDVYRKLAALELLTRRRALAGKLRESGMSVVESPALTLSRAALRRYREVKLSGRL